MTNPYRSRLAPLLAVVVALGCFGACDQRGADPDSQSSSTALSACSSGPNEDPCGACVAQKCCTEWTSCKSSTDCAKGGPAGTGELSCQRACLAQKGGNAAAACSAQCATPGHTNLAPATQAILGCIASQCGGECPSG